MRLLVEGLLRCSTRVSWCQRKRCLSFLTGQVDRYGGITVDLKAQLPADTSLQHFQGVLKGMNVD